MKVQVKVKVCRCAGSPRVPVPGQGQGRLQQLPQGTIMTTSQGFLNSHSNQVQHSAMLSEVRQVMIPADPAPGRYVVSWRWDCEETDQVWQSCADVNILPQNKKFK